MVLERPLRSLAVKALFCKMAEMRKNHNHIISGQVQLILLSLGGGCTLIYISRNTHSVP